MQSIPAFAWTQKFGFWDGNMIPSKKLNILVAKLISHLKSWAYDPPQKLVKDKYSTRRVSHFPSSMFYTHIIKMFIRRWLQPLLTETSVFLLGGKPFLIKEFIKLWLKPLLIKPRYFWYWWGELFLIKMFIRLWLQPLFWWESCRWAAV